MNLTLPVPCQVFYLGTPLTTGSPHVQYFIGDAIVSPLWHCLRGTALNKLYTASFPTRTLALSTNPHPAYPPPLQL